VGVSLFKPITSLWVFPYSYSSIVRGQEVVKLRDTVFIRSVVPSKPYVAEILSFYQNTMDGHADIYWYFRPEEFTSTLRRKIPARNRPQLPPLGGNEVVMVNQKESIEVTSISGLAVVKRLSPIDKVAHDPSPRSSGGDTVIMRFCFDFLKNSLLAIEDYLASSSSASLSNGGSGLESQSGAESDSSGHVRHRSKGELRPVVSARKSFSPAVASPSDRAACNKKKWRKDWLGVSSPATPGKSSPALSHRQPASPLLKSQTHSKVTTPTRASNFDFDSLLPNSVKQKRKTSYFSPEYWVGRRLRRTQVQNSDDESDTPKTEEGRNSDGSEEEVGGEDEWTPVSKTPRTQGNSRLLAGGTPKSSRRTASAARGRVGRHFSAVDQEVDLCVVCVQCSRQEGQN